MISGRSKSIVIIAGLDPSGGAGLIADVRVAHHQKVRPCGVVTAETVQNTRGVQAVRTTDPNFLAAQLSALLRDVDVAAIKIGMLGTEAIARVVAAAVADIRAPIVWDPVGAPTAGLCALYDGSLAKAAELFGGRLTAITPNLSEAAELSGQPVDNFGSMAVAAATIRDRTGAAVLVTGGHVESEPDADVTDILATQDCMLHLAHRSVQTPGPVHGTGCALSTALACRLALGDDIVSAAKAARGFVREQLLSAVQPGHGLPAVW